MNRSIILVGNGPSARTRRFGVYVDEFETVCRFNNFVTGGYCGAVGNKTDIWAVCSGNIRDRDQRQFGEVLFCVPACIYDDPDEWDWHPKRPYTLIPQDVVVAVTKKVGASQNIWPSTGMLALEYFLSFHEQVVVHGFDHFQDDAQHHYFPDKDKNWFHNGPAEKRYLDELIRAGRVTTLSREVETLRKT